MSRAATIGIIGGADGPTAIFVTTGGGMGWLLPVLILASIGIWLFWRRRKK